MPRKGLWTVAGLLMARGALVPALPARGLSKCAGLSVCLDTHLALVLWLKEGPGHPRCLLSPSGHALAGWEVGDLDSGPECAWGLHPRTHCKDPPRGEGQDFPPARPRDPHAHSASLHKGTSRDHARVRSGRCGVQTRPWALAPRSSEEGPSVKQFTCRLAVFLPKPRC